VANIVIGVGSLSYNLYEGNYTDAAIDAGGLVVDVVATAIPVVPGGAEAAIKAYRAGDKAADLLKFATKADEVMEVATKSDEVVGLADEAAGLADEVFGNIANGPDVIYRTESQTDNAFTDPNGVSFRDSVSSSANGEQVFRPGDKLYAVDTRAVQF
jgi:hypothetical protein